jgi:hypothetical protein
MASNVDKLFPPKMFNDSAVNTALITKEKSIAVIFRDEEYKHLYDNFDNLYSLYLSKLPENHIKKYVSQVFNKNIVFIGISSSAKNDAVFSRLLVLENRGVVNGIVLDANVLDIDIETGDTSSIDNCIYATYFSIIRSAVLLNVDKITSNTMIHKLVIQYIWLTILKAVGQKSVYNMKQKNLVYLACIYTFYAHFIKLKHPMIVSKIKKEYKEHFDQEIFKEIIPLVDDIKKYQNIKDIPSILVDFRVYNDIPSKIYIELFKILGNTGFYNFISSLDQLISMIVLSKYPTMLYNKSVMTSEKIHNKLESDLLPFIDAIKFSKLKSLYD